MMFSNKGVDLTASGAFNTDSILTEQLRFISFVFHLTGTVTRSLQLQGSNDGTNWVNKGSAVAVSAAGNFTVEPSNFWNHKYARVAFDAGTGSLGSDSSGTFHGKF